MGRRGYLGKVGSDWESRQRRNWEPLADSIIRAWRQSAHRPSWELTSGDDPGAVIRLSMRGELIWGWADRRARRAGGAPWASQTAHHRWECWSQFWWRRFSGSGRKPLRRIPRGRDISNRRHRENRGNRF